jgi:hypothetical protein
MKKILALFWALIPLICYTQTVVDPATFPIEPNPNNSNFEFYTRKTGENKKATFNGVKLNMAPESRTVAYFPGLTGNTQDLGNFVTDPSGNKWYIAANGAGILVSQTAYSAGAGISVSGGGVIANTGDLSATNEIQTISLSGATLSLSLGGGSVTIPSAISYLPGTGISISGTTINNTGDLSATNEGKLTVSPGTDSTAIINSNTLGQVPVTLLGRNIKITESGSTIILTGAKSDTVRTTARLTGIGSVASPLDIAQQGATAGQVLKWNGSAWIPFADEGTNVSAGTGITVTGTPPNITINNSGDTNAGDDITTSTMAGGDLSGLYPNPTVDGLQGRAVSSTAPTTGQVLTWNGNWTPSFVDSVALAANGVQWSDLSPAVKAYIASLGGTGRTPQDSVFKFENRTYRVVAGTVRYYSTPVPGWRLLKDIDHHPIGVDTVWSDATYIRFKFNFTGTQAISLLVGPDEVYGGYSVGCSLGFSTADCVIRQTTYKRNSAYCYYTAADSSWSCIPSGFSGPVTATYDKNSGALVVTHTNLSSDQAAQVTWRSNNFFPVTAGNYSNITSRFVCLDHFGFPHIPVNNNGFYWEREFNVPLAAEPVNPATLTNDFGNFWFFGIQEIANTP